MTIAYFKVMVYCGLESVGLQILLIDPSRPSRQVNGGLENVIVIQLCPHSVRVISHRSFSRSIEK